MKATVWTTDGESYTYFDATSWDVDGEILELLNDDLEPIAIFHSKDVHHVEFMDRDS